MFEDGAYADRALHGEAKQLDARDRALAMRLVYGAVQRKGTLDYLIERLADRPPEQLDARLLAALRLGLYELLYLSGAPDHAVVADGVELAKGARAAVTAWSTRCSGGVRARAPRLLEALSDETPEQAAIKHSHPEWIARLWWKELGASDARALMAYDNEPGEMALRVNTLLTDAATLADELPVATHPIRFCPRRWCWRVRSTLMPRRAWRAGAFLAQSRAAMRVSRCSDPRPGERVLDLCAAPGGKSTHLAALMGGEGEMVAVERNARRAGMLTRTAQRLHVPNIRVEVADAAVKRPEGAVFDRVLVDPPCSGLGTLQARADLRWRVTEENVREMIPIQASILAAGAAAVRPGGVLVYSTCTISPTENELQIAAFLDAPSRLQPR